MRRERHNLSMLTAFTSTARSAHSAQIHLASPSSESQPSSSEVGTQLTDFFQISAHASSAWRHPNTLVPIPIWDFYFDISEWHILSVHAWKPALMLHLTNPCTKRKVLILTKPKGKIYKTKSLHNYVTLWCQSSTNSYADNIWYWNNQPMLKNEILKELKMIKNYI